jgi:hypothetical protein
MPRGVVAAARTALVFVGSPLTISAAKPSANGSRAGNHRAIQTEFIRGCARLNKYADDSRRKGIVPQPATKFFYEFEYEDLCYAGIGSVNGVFLNHPKQYCHYFVSDG